MRYHLSANARHHLWGSELRGLLVDRYEKLKAEIGDIARAVNEFKSERVQEQAFVAMVKALSGEGPIVADASDEKLAPTVGDELITAASKTTARARRRGSAAASADGAKARPKSGPVTQDKTLDLNPKGKTSFLDFIAAKAPPDNQHDHNVLAVYWLINDAGFAKVTADQVYTCYRSAGWKLPGDFRNSLQRTASIKGWLDTKASDDLKITPQGINFVERQLPPKKA
jgi:hypothetical protein